MEIFVWLFLGLYLRAEAACFPGTLSETSSTYKELDSAIHDFAIAINNGEMARAMKWCTEHTWLMPPGHVGVPKLRAIAKYFATLFGTRHEMTDVETVEAGTRTKTVAWIRGKLRFNGMDGYFSAVFDRLLGPRRWRFLLFSWTISRHNPKPAIDAFLADMAIKTVKDAEAAEKSGETPTDPSIVTEIWPNTVRNDTVLWQQMHDMAWDLTLGINEKDFERTFGLYGPHSWTFPPSYVDVIGSEDTAEFIRVLFMANTTIIKTTLFEVGGTDLLAYCRGSTKVNFFKSLFLIICERATPQDKWVTNTLAWATAAENPTPAFRAVIEQDARKKAAEEMLQQNEGSQ